MSKSKITKATTLSLQKTNNCDREAANI